jgi:hypothetical protein
MAGFRCGCTGLVRDNPNPRLARVCPGCPDCSRCHGSKQRYRFDMIMVDGKQGVLGGDGLFTLQIEECPGCQDCKVIEGKPDL